jgi:hypothetical protein
MSDRGTKGKALRPRLFVLAMLAAVALPAGAALAQSAPPPKKKHNNNTYGSPLDTIMHTHLWTDVAPAKDFVRESRPDNKTLDYTPLTGTDPVRPKPRDAANVMALQAELEHDLAVNTHKGGLPPSAMSPAAKKSRSKAQSADATRTGARLPASPN